MNTLRSKKIKALNLDIETRRVSDINFPKVNNDIQYESFHNFQCTLVARWQNNDEILMGPRAPSKKINKIDFILQINKVSIHNSIINIKTLDRKLLITEKISSAKAVTPAIFSEVFYEHKFSKTSSSDCWILQFNPRNSKLENIFLKVSLKWLELWCRDN